MSGLEKIALAAAQLEESKKKGGGQNTQSKIGDKDADEKTDTAASAAVPGKASSASEQEGVGGATTKLNGEKRPAPPPSEGVEEATTTPSAANAWDDQKPFAFKRGIIDLNTFLEMQVQLSNLPPPPLPPAPNVALQLHDGDVIFGRGGTSNHHKGNIRYRILVKKYQRLYLQAKRGDKPKIAMLIVDTIRREHGRFLKKNEGTSQWHDVGNQKAREKTSQALRERAPEIRAETSGRPSKKSKSGKSWGLATIGMVDPASALGATAMQIAKETLAAREFPEFSTDKKISLFKSVDDATDETKQVTEKLEALKKQVISGKEEGDDASDKEVKVKEEGKEEVKEKVKEEAEGANGNAEGEATEAVKEKVNDETKQPSDEMSSVKPDGGTGASAAVKQEPKDTEVLGGVTGLITGATEDSKESTEEKADYTIPPTVKMEGTPV